MLGTLEKLAGNKLLQLLVEPIFTKGQVNLLDILDEDYMESCSKSDMNWKILLRYSERIKYPHLSGVLCFKILKSNKNPGTSIKKFAAEVSFHSSPSECTSIFALFLLCKEVV